MKLTIAITGGSTPNPTVTIEADSASQQIITTLATTLLQLSQSAQTFADVLERESKAETEE